MRLWRRATGALKDHSSIWRCSVNSSTSSSSTSLSCSKRELEAMIIKATSHDETRIDYKNVQRLFSWIRDSPDDVIKPLVSFLSMRLQKTRSWVVALKALMLFHGLLRFNDIPHIENLGRLPFDLSTFTDAGSHSSTNSTSSYNAFIRAYFAFLDHKSTSLSLSSSSTQILIVRTSSDSTTHSCNIIITRLLSLHQLLHSSIELLLQVRPHSGAMIETRRGRTLIVEAMDCILMEIFDVYTQSCACLKRLVSPTILNEASDKEAVMVLEALQQSNDQEEDLQRFFEFYDNFGLLKESGRFPNIKYVTEDEVRQVEWIAKQNPNYEAAEAGDGNCQIVAAVTTTEDSGVGHQRLASTIITEKWEVFDDDEDATRSLIPLSVTKTSTTDDDCAAPSQLSLLVPIKIVHVYKHEIPDFITF